MIAIVALLLWDSLWVKPRMQAETTAFQPLLQLEAEVATLKTSGSDNEATAIASRAADTAKNLVADPKQLGPTLEDVSKLAQTFGWDASFSVIPGPPTPAAAPSLFAFVSARGKLAPKVENEQPIGSLLALLERFSPPDRSIDLTRLTVRADEQGRHVTEVSLRFGCRTPANEKAPE